MSHQQSTKSILLEAVRLEDPAARRQYLESACGTDTQRFQRISSWLENGQHQQNTPLDVAVSQLHFADRLHASGATDSGESEPGRVLGSPPHDLRGARIGPYEILERLGQGGMGEVFLASQTSPINRKVALKLTNFGTLSSQLAAHIEAERRALELMDHPGIARVLDAGTTTWGTPFFVMELVSGQRITDYSHDHTLTLNDRLKLFVDICLAVQHAHQKGIVHRDIKPSNVLVTVHDSKPMIKIIDFGIAQAIDRAADERLSDSSFLRGIGTPLYMSPEQASLSATAVDTRSDVYSLGILLYELICKTTPFDPDRFRTLEGAELCRVVREEVPPLPSSHLLNTRSSEARRVRLDLDWVVMKAIAKQPSDRYPTASGLADDIQRFLDGKPVMAHPSDWRYRSIKWLSAHKAAFVTSLVIASCMLLATVISLLSARDSRQARDASQSLLFAADMKVASDAFHAANILPARQRLERHIPRAGEIDRRNFAWHYLWNQLNPETKVIATESPLFEIRFAPDGQTYATGHESGEVLLWSLGSDKPIRRLENHSDIVRHIAYSPDGKWLASGSDDGQLRLWELEQATPPILIQAHTPSVMGIAWIDNERIVTAGDRDIKLWYHSSLVSGSGLSPRNSNEIPPQLQSPYQAIGQFSEEILALAVSPDCQELAVASRDFSIGGSGLISCWDLKSGQKKAECVITVKPISMAYHPAGKQLAVGTQSGDIYTVDSQDSGRTLIASKIPNARHSSNVYRVTFSTDGTRLVSASKDSTLKVWDTADWDCEKTIQSHMRRVYAVDFCPGTHTFASASADSTIRFFDSSSQPFDQERIPIPLETRYPQAGEKISQYPKCTPESARYLRCQERIFVFGCCWDNGYYDSRTGQFVSLPFPGMHNMAISSDGRLLLGCPSDGVMVPFDSAAQRLEQTQPFQVDLDGDGILDRIGGFGEDGRLVWQKGLSTNLADFNPPCLFGYQPRSPRRRLAKSESVDSEILFSFDEAWGRMGFERVQGGNLMEYTFLENNLPKNLLWKLAAPPSDNLPTVLLAFQGQGGILCYPESNRENRFVIETGLTGISAIHGYCRGQSTKMDCLVVADTNRHIHLFRSSGSLEPGKGPDERASFNAVQQFECPTEIWDLDVTQNESGEAQLHVAGPDGIFSYNSSGDQWLDQPIRSDSLEGSPWLRALTSNVVVYDLHHSQLVTSFRSPEHHIWAQAISDDGNLIATAGEGDYLRLWNFSGDLLASLSIPRNAKYCMEFTSDSNALCVGVGDDIYVYDVRRQKLLHQLKGHENTVHKLAISPSDQILATTSHDLTVRLWSLKTGQPLAVLVGHTSIPNNVTFTLDGRLIATSDHSGIVKLWDVDTAGELLELQDFDLPVQCLAFDTANSLLALGWDGELTANPQLQLGRWSITNTNGNGATDKKH
jgi:WD40 repeat protein